MAEHIVNEYGTTDCPVERVRADIDDDGCSACGWIDWKARHDDLAAALVELADNDRDRRIKAEGLREFRRLAVRCYPKGMVPTAQVVADLDERIDRGGGRVDDPAAVLADRDRRIKAEATADALTVAAVLLRRVFDYWEGRPISMHAGHLWDDFRDVLTAIERDAEHNRREGGRA